MYTFIKLLLAITGITLISHRAVSSESCSQLFQIDTSESSKANSAIDVIGISIQIREISVGQEESPQLQLFNSLRSHSFEFNIFVEKRKQELKVQVLTVAESKALLTEFLQLKWKAYQDPVQLKNLQNSAIDRELDARQSPAGAIKGWDRLSRLSQQNFKRLVKEARLSPMTQYSPEIVQATQLLKLNIYRNTKIPMTLGRGVLSSRQIQNIAGVRGKNSMFPFNFDFLKGDDSIFFYIDVALNSSKRDSTPLRSDFGEYNKTLDPDKLPSQGWVAPYIMYFSEMEAIHQANPQILGGPTIIEEGFAEKEKYIPTPSEKKAANSLVRYYFTTRDFQNLLQMAYAQMISTYLFEHPGATVAQAAEAVIEPTYGSQLAPILKKLGLPEKMEYKVPVFVDRQHFIENSGQN